MEEFKGTTGPWSKNKYGEAVDTHGEVIPIWGVALSNGIEAKANANLVISAPELLEALQDFMANASGEAESCGHSFECVCRFDKAKAAIAKALGK